MTGFDWPQMMRVGLHHLRLHPDEFWALTPLEFLIMAGMVGAKSPAMSRAELAQLVEQFPDDETE